MSKISFREIKNKITKLILSPSGHILMMSKMVKGMVNIHKSKSEIARFVMKIL
jgi:hypothetical protein